MDALLDRVQRASPESTHAMCADANVEPGHVMVAIRTPAGCAVYAVQMSEWDAIKALDAWNLPVPPALRTMAKEFYAGGWTRAAQDRRAAQERAAAVVTAEKKASASARPTKSARA